MKKSWLNGLTIIWYSAALLLTPGIIVAAEKQSRETLESLLISWFPMLLLVAVWIYFMKKKGVQWQSSGGEEMNRHLEKIEQSLERIAKALEKRDK
jgi:ATP-dependent Zn protease